MSMERRLFLAFKRVEVFGRVLFALLRLRNGVEWSFKRLWHVTGVEVERFYSSR